MFLSSEMKDWCLSFYEGIGSPRALSAYLMLKADMYAELVTADINPHHYLNPSDFRRDAAAVKLLSKFDGVVEGLDPEKVALEKWFEAEHCCFRANRRFYPLLDIGDARCAEPYEASALSFFAEVKKWVTWLIGAAPPQIVEGRFGPGATISDKSGLTTVAHKMSSIPTYTPEACYFLVPWTGTAWAKAQAAAALPVPFATRGNHFFTVNKNAKTKRSCAKEASINAYFQRGYGQVMAHRLRGKGIDISPWSESQHFTVNKPYAASEVHVQVARLASLKGRFATIDLSMASDTICEALVRLCFPVRWYEVLSDLRAKRTLINKRWYQLEKFSSMGNGYTFELETTLFTAICLAACPGLQPGKSLFVFGDDIIVPTDNATHICNALTFCGFQMNKDKTFLTSEFRESCGGDYFMGQAVRPYHLKGNPNEPHEIISMANGIRRLAYQDPHPYGLRSDLRKSWFRLLDMLPSHIRHCRGPRELGDIVIHDEEKHWSYRTRQQKRYLRVYRPARWAGVSFERFGPLIQFAVALHGVPWVNPRYPTNDFQKQILPRRPERPKPLWNIYCDYRQLSFRDNVSGYKVGWVPFS